MVYFSSLSGGTGRGSLLGRGSSTRPLPNCGGALRDKVSRIGFLSVVLVIYSGITLALILRNQSPISGSSPPSGTMSPVKEWQADRILKDTHPVEKLWQVLPEGLVAGGSDRIALGSPGDFAQNQGALGGDEGVEEKETGLVPPHQADPAVSQVRQWLFTPVMLCFYFARESKDNVRFNCMCMCEEVDGINTSAVSVFRSLRTKIGDRVAKIAVSK